MTAGVPWSVSAVDPDTWDAAREAARRAGLSVGEWLELAIRENSIGGHGRGRNPATGFDRRLDDLADQINLIARRNAEYRPAPPIMPAPDRGGEQIAASLDALTDRIDELLHGMARVDRNNGRDEISSAIRKLDNRIESLITDRPSSGGNDSEVERKLDEMARVISAMSERLEQEVTYTASPELAPTAAELDAAVAEIMERQSALDGTPAPARPARSNGHHAPATPHIAKLERQLKTIADEMQSMRKASANNAHTPLVELRRDIQELARTMADLAPRRTLESLEQTVDALARKVDRSSTRRDDRAAQSVLAALDEIRNAIATVRPAESFVSVEGDLNALSNKLDVINAKSIDGTTVARIQNQIQEVRDLLSNALPAETLQNVVAQIETVASKVDRLGTPDDSGMRDVVGSLERRIDALAERIEMGAQHASPGGEALERINLRLDSLQTALDRAENPMGLEETMRTVVERLDASEAKLANLGSIERGISDLSEQFDKARASAMEVAERAAKTALRELQAARLQAAPAPEQSITPPASSIPAGVPRPLAGDAPAPSRAVAVQESQPRFTRATPSTVKLSTEPVATDGLPADFPLEPGSGAPKSRPTPVQQRIAQSEAAVADIAPRPADGNQRTSDFIAAARRAAQAAAIETTETGEAAPGKKGAMQGAFSRGRRAILLGLVVAMIGFSAVRFFDVSLITSFLGGETPAPVVEQPAKNTPLIPDAAPAPQSPLIPEQRSLIPGLIDPTAALAPPSGNISPTAATSIMSQNPDPAVITNSTPQQPQRNQKTANVAPAAAPEVAAPPVTGPQLAAANELPASIGNTALRAAAINGDPDAAYEIAERYLAGRGVKSDVTEAIKWFERSVAKGSAVAAFRLGMAFEKGLGVPKDRARARTNYVLAANAGHLKAMHNLAVMMVEEPRADNKPDYASAIPWFRKAAEHGLRDSQYNLGVLYARGLGVQQNLAESFRWFALAANQGDADAAKKRDDVAGRLDQQTLVATRLAVQTWTAQPINQGANAAYLKPEWQKTAETPAKKKSKK
jgi:localization factor PodJL